MFFRHPVQNLGRFRRGLFSMSSFDPSSISSNIDVVAIKTTSKHVQQLRKAFSSIILKRTAIKPIQSADNNSRLILLEPKAIPNKESAESKLNVAQRKLIDETENTSLVDHNITLDFKSFSTEEILAKLLPPEIAPVRGYETIGHIAHLNLRDDMSLIKN